MQHTRRESSFRPTEKYITNQLDSNVSTLAPCKEIDFQHYVSTVKNTVYVKLIPFHACFSTIRLRKSLAKSIFLIPRSTMFPKRRIGQHSTLIFDPIFHSNHTAVQVFLSFALMVPLSCHLC